MTLIAATLPVRVTLLLLLPAIWPAVRPPATPASTVSVLPFSTDRVAVMLALAASVSLTDRPVIARLVSSLVVWAPGTVMAGRVKVPFENCSLSTLDTVSVPSGEPTRVSVMVRTPLLMLIA